MGDYYPIPPIAKIGDVMGEVSMIIASHSEISFPIEVARALDLADVYKVLLIFI